VHKCAVGTFVGCYNDTGMRLLPKLQPQLHDVVTLENCASACYTASTALAGVDGGNHCSCGNAVADGPARTRQPAECEASSCHGNRSEAWCGGTNRMVVYTFTCEHLAEVHGIEKVRGERVAG
jgi:hypothetical protein